MPSEAAALLERLQPFQRDGSAAMGKPEDDPLVLLQWLNNTDKHRVPPVVLVAPTKITHSPTVEFYSSEDAGANIPPDTIFWVGPLKPGAVLLEWKTKHPIASVKGQYEAHAIVAVQTNDGPKQLDIHIANIGQYTALVVDQFRRFFLSS
jgi:hypothetical protein